MLKKITALFFLIFCLVMYILTVRGEYGNINPQNIPNNLDKATKPLELSPERGRFLLTMSLDENKSFALSPQLTEAAKPDVGYYKGKYYVYFAPGISLMAWPLYALGKIVDLSQVFAFFLSSIFATLNFFVLYKIAKNMLKLPFWASLVAGFIYSFASGSWSYAITLYQHQATTFFLLSGLYCAWVFKQKTAWSIPAGVWTWAAYGLAIAIDYPNGLLLLPMMVYFFFNAFSLSASDTKFHIHFRPAFIFCSLLFIAISVAHGYYNHTNFGSWKSLSGSIPSYKAATTSAEMLVKLQEDKNPVGFFTEKNFVKGFHVLSVSDERGVLYFFPIFIIAIFGLFWAFRHQTPETIALMGSGAMLVFLYSSWGDPWGGWAFGPRYMIPTMGILSLFAAQWVSIATQIVARKIFTLALFIFSSGVALLGALTTNQIPPASEAVLLINTGYNYFYNWQFLVSNQSGSFFYNNIAKSSMSLMQYGVSIWIALIIVFFSLLFILPKITRHDH